MEKERFFISFKDKVAGKYGFKNTETDEIVILPMYDFTSLGFHINGLAIVANNRKYGCIDPANKIVIPLAHTSG